MEAKLEQNQGELENAQSKLRPLEQKLKKYEEIIKDLKKRREIAKLEIQKLTQKVEKLQGSQDLASVASGGAPNCQTEESSPGKNLDTMSVHSIKSHFEESKTSVRVAQASDPALSKELSQSKLLLKEVMKRDAGILKGVKKELENIYKDLILIIFTPKKDEEHNVKTERRVNSLIMSIND